MPGSEGGVRKHSAAVRLAPTLLDQGLELWKRDACSQPAKPEPAKEKEEDLVTVLTEILKGKRPSR
jgi:hypothetical protein